MKNEDPPPIRFHDVCKPSDYREMAELIARQLLLWAGTPVSPSGR